VLFNIANYKETSIADNVERANGAIQWNIQFTWLIHDWEVEVLASFYRCLYFCKLREDGGDKLWWVPSCKGGFEVKSFYRALSAHRPISFPWKSIWRSKAPPRVVFFAWMATCSKILTLDNLRRGMVVVNRCWLCESDGESVDHLLLHCVLQGLCGMLSSPSLGFAGLCLAQSKKKKNMPAGRQVAIREVRLFGKWFLFALCSALGGSTMIGALRISRGLMRNFSICSYLLSSLGLWGGWPHE
jgi:hypothetical protein